MVCCAAAPCRSDFPTEFGGFHFPLKAIGTINSRRVKSSILLFASLLTISLARQRCLDTLLFARLQIIGVTLDFLDDVLRLNLSLEPAQRIFQRLAFLNANFSQELPPPSLPLWLLRSYPTLSETAKSQSLLHLGEIRPACGALRKVI